MLHTTNKTTEHHTALRCVWHPIRSGVNSPLAASWIETAIDSSDGRASNSFPDGPPTVKAPRTRTARIALHPARISTAHTSNSTGAIRLMRFSGAA